MTRRRGFRFSSTLLFLFLLSFVINAIPAGAQDGDPDAPYVPTPDTVVQTMLDLADLQKGDYLIDLGSGDGRIPIAAARRGAYAHGIEIDPSLVAKARKKARDAGVEDRAAFVEGDIFKQKIHRANIITMYLYPEMMEKLKPRLLESLKPGTRIVSHLFHMDDWQPDQKVTIEPDFQQYLNKVQLSDTLTGLSHLITLNHNAPAHLFPKHEVYMWIIPADVKGTWHWKIGSDDFQATIRQEYQQLDVIVNGERLQYNTTETSLRGRRISFSIRRNELRYNFSGTVRSDTIRGIVQIHRSNSSQIYPWKATRKSATP